MRGSAYGQVKTVMQEIQAFGQSKHSAKAEARKNLAAQGKTASWHNVGKEIGIHSYLTNDQYMKVNIEAFQYIKENLNVKDILNLEPQHIQSYLESKVESGVKYSTLQSYSAALEKLEVALNEYAKSHDLGKTYDFHEAIQSVKDSAHKKLDHSVKAGAFSNPWAVINVIKNETYRIIAEAQYSGGLRLSELNKISTSNFLGNNKFLVKRSKGGLTRTVTFRDSEAYENFKNLVSQSNGKFSFSTNSYKHAVATAAKLVDEKYTADHSFRHNYAQEKYSELRQEGKNELQAKIELSRELGHSRLDIVNKYL